jgi:hypothetical protein
MGERGERGWTAGCEYIAVLMADCGEEGAGSRNEAHWLGRERRGIVSTEGK